MCHVSRKLLILQQFNSTNSNMLYASYATVCYAVRLRTAHEASSFMLHYFEACYIMSRHATLCRGMLQNDEACDITFHYVEACYIILHNAVGL